MNTTSELSCWGVTRSGEGGGSHGGVGGFGDGCGGGVGGVGGHISADYYFGFIF